MNKMYLIVLLSLVGCVAFAQNQSNIWYFGDKAGLDFNGTAPVALLDSELVSGNSVAAIADENGQLLFYTNGFEVRDKTHNIMPNGAGLEGNDIYQQGVIIVPKPASPGIYYIITADFDYNGYYYDNIFGTVRYSEVNMALNGGLGDITEAKNVFLLLQSTISITAVVHSNGTDVWVITHDVNNNTFHSTLVTAQGITTVPVISNTGPVIEAGITNSHKVSPNGEKIAMVCNGTYLFDFNDQTGQVSNAAQLSTLSGRYGVEFSPSGKLLYVSDGFSQQLFQYNTEAADIGASQIELTGYPDIFNVYGGGGALQLAPDGKIYYSTGGYQTNLNVINYPDVTGPGCFFAPHSIDLGGRFPVYGLPQFISSYFKPTIKAEHLCLGDTTDFSILSVAAPDSALWDFGDGNTSTQLVAQHTYASPGSYNTTLTIMRQGQAFTYSKYIAIEALPVATPPTDVVLCDDGSPVFFDLSTLNVQILGTQIPASFVVSYHSTDSDAEGGSNAVAKDYEVTENSQVLYARVTSLTGCYAITNVTIEKLPIPVITGQNNYVLCEGEPITLTAQGPYDGFIWSTGAAATSITVTEPGDYFVTGSLASGALSCASRAVPVAPAGSPQIVDVEVADWTDAQNTITITAQGTGAFEYSTDGINYQESPVFTGLSDGQYTVYARSIYGCGTDSQNIYLLMYPRFFTPDNDGINDTWQIKGIRFEPNTIVEVYNRFGKLLSSFNGRDAGWNGKLSGQQLPATDYWFVVKRQNGAIYKGHFSLLR